MLNDFRWALLCDGDFVCARVRVSHMPVVR